MEASILEKRMQKLMETTGYDERTLQSMLDDGFTEAEIIMTVLQVRREIREEKRKLGKNYEKKKDIIFVMDLLNQISSGSKSPDTIKWVNGQKDYWKGQYARLS